MKKSFHKIIHYITSRAVKSKYLLQDKHSFKPMLIEIEDRPVSPVGHFILWTIVIVFLISLGGLYFAKIDVVVTARGKFIPSGNVKTIQATYNGIIKDILVKEGDIVKKGQLLIKADVQLIKTKIQAKQNESNNLFIKQKRLSSLIENINFYYEPYMKKEQYKYEKNIFKNELFALKKKELVFLGKIMISIKIFQIFTKINCSYSLNRYS